MDPILGLVGSIGGGLINNLFAGHRQDQAQAFAQQQAAQAEANFRLNRQTAYQDTMADMKAAGLNPILAYQRGATGSTMSPTPTPSAAPVSDIGIGSGINSALAIRNANQDIQNKQSTQANTDASTDLLRQQKLTEAQKTRSAESDAAIRANDTILSTWGLEAKWQEYKQAKDQNEWIDNNPTAAKALHEAGYAVKAGTNVVKPIVDTVKDAVPFLGSSGKSSNQTPPSFNDRWGSGRPAGQPFSAKDAATRDPGMVPGGIRERAYKGVFPNRGEELMR